MQVILAVCTTEFAVFAMIEREITVVKKVALVTNHRQPLLETRSEPRRRPNSARRLRPGLSPGNTERVPAQAIEETA